MSLCCYRTFTPCPNWRLKCGSRSPSSWQTPVRYRAEACTHTRWASHCHNFSCITAQFCGMSPLNRPRAQKLYRTERLQSILTATVLRHTINGIPVPCSWQTSINGWLMTFDCHHTIIYAVRNYVQNKSTDPHERHMTLWECIWSIFLHNSLSHLRRITREYG